MCDGRLLWDIDENGVRMDYAYDTARQLVETTRSAVMDGETVITPEIITTYTRDAAGRILSTRRDTGAMTTSESSEYDLLGRITSSTDVLGRVTTYAYSQDGLTTTQTISLGSHVRHAQRAGWNGPGRIRHGTAAYQSIPLTWLPTVFGPSRKPSPVKRKPNCKE